MDKPQFNPAAFNTAPLNTPTEPSPQERPIFDATTAEALTEKAAAEKVDLQKRPLGAISTWSYTALLDYETCPFRSYLKRVKRVKEPESEAMDRGSRLHTAIEDFITGKTDSISKEVKHRHSVIERFAQEYPQGTVEVEENWGFARDWTITGWMSADVWARIKLDVFFRESETSAEIVDWKSGKKFGNEIKHAQQNLVYAIAAFHRYPELEFIHTSMQYIDKNEELVGRYTASEAAMFKPKIEERALRMTTATEFPPKPSIHNCRFCTFKELTNDEGQPHCPWGVTQ